MDVKNFKNLLILLAEFWNQAQIDFGYGFGYEFGFGSGCHPRPDPIYSFFSAEYLLVIHIIYSKYFWISFVDSNSNYYECRPLP